MFKMVISKCVLFIDTDIDIIIGIDNGNEISASLIHFISQQPIGIPFDENGVYWWSPPGANPTRNPTSVTNSYTRNRMNSNYPQKCPLANVVYKSSGKIKIAMKVSYHRFLGQQ